MKTVDDLPPEVRAAELERRGFTPNDAQRVEAFALSLLNSPDPEAEDSNDENATRNR